MNKTFRSIWNASKQAFVAAAETVTTRGKPSSGAKTAAAMTALLGGLLGGWLGLGGAAQAAPPATAPAPNQLPTGGQLSAGSASIGQSGANMVIHQSTDRAAIHWQTFNVGSNAQVQFNQPGSSSVTLNRVMSSDPSQIFGRITANGQVILTNPSGVYFGPSARVDVGGLVATTHGISNTDFMAGSNKFDRQGSTASVLNEGELKASLGGYIALLAPEVRNQGAVIAQMGTVALASGEAIDLKFDSNNRLTSLRVEPSQIAALVDNRHAVQAPGGLVIISAQSMDRLAGGVVKNSGAIEANSLTAKGGRIVLEADHITLQSGSRIDASGATGGGTVLVGGDWQGSGDMHQATTVTMEQGASIDASATSQGDGGKVVLWSNVHNANSVTSAQGQVTAKGGAQGGSGGMIETSGYRLFTAGVSGSAAGGLNSPSGHWLFDPYDYTIGSTEATTIAGLLNAGTSVEILSSNSSSHGISGNSGSGHITVNSGIYAWTGNAGLTLNAGTSGDVQINAEIDIRGPLSVYGNNITLNAGQSWGSGIRTYSGGASANILFKARGDIIQTSGGPTTAGGGSIVYWSDSDGSGDGRIEIANVNIDNNLGSIVMGGGAAGSAQPAGPARGSYGISIDNAQISPGYGDVILRGASNRTGSSEGVGIKIVNTVMMHGRDVTIEGWGAANAGPYDNNHGVQLLNVWMRTDRNISITGTGGGSAGTAGGNNHGVMIANQSTIDSTWASAVGSITITGTGGGNSSTVGNTNNDGVVVQDSGVWSGSGAVTLIGTAGAGTGPSSFSFPISTNYSEGIALVSSGSSSYSQIGIDSAQSSSRQTGNITLRADSIALDTSLGGEHKLLTAGTLTMEPLGASFSSPLYLFGPNNTLTLSTRLTGLQLGKPGNTGDILIWSPWNMNGVISVAGPIALYGGSVDFSAALVATGTNTITLQATQDINGASVSANQLALLGGGVWLRDTNNSINTLAASGIGALNFVNSGALTVGAVGSTSGVTATGPISIATLSGDLNITQSLTTTDASAAAIVLNADASASRGASTGGNLVFSGSPALNIGQGGLAKLFTGSVIGSTGLTDLVGTGSGRFRYNSDETASGYDTTHAALGSGLYAIYRERPTIDVTATATAIYGTASTVTTAINHAVNGDTSTQAISGMTLNIGGNTSTAGHYIVGNHPITLSGGSSLLGYAIGNYTQGTLTVSPKTLTTTNIAVNDKVYDGTTLAALSGGALVGVEGSDVVALQSLAGTFSSRHAANGLAVTATASLDGADSGNYTLALPTGLSGNITPKPVTLTPQASSRTYDGSTGYTATASDLTHLSAQLGVTGDTVSGVTLSFADKNVGTGKTLTATAATLSDGNSGNNYLITLGANNTSTINRLNSVTWTGGANGNWFDPANWFGGAVPDLANVANVVIPSGAAVNFDTRAAVAPANASATVLIDGLTGSGGSLTQANGHLSIGTGGITLGQFTLTGGTLSNAGDTHLDAYTQSGGAFSGSGEMVVDQFRQSQGTTSLQSHLTVNQVFNQSPGGSTSVGGQANITNNSGITQLGNLSVASDLSIHSNDGAIEQHPNTILSAGGTSHLTAFQGIQAAAITLTNATNDFSGMVSAQGAALSLSAAHGLAVNLDVAGAASLQVGDALSINGTVSGPSGSLSTTATQISYGDLTVDGRLRSTTTGSGPQGGIVQTGRLVVRGDALFVADTGTLQNASLGLNNDFGGHVSFTTNHGENWNDLILNGITGLSLGNMTSTGFLRATAANDLAIVGDISAASLDLTATIGDITQANNSTLTIPTGHTTLQAGGRIMLNQTNNGSNSTPVTPATPAAPGGTTGSNNSGNSNSVVDDTVEKVQAAIPSKTPPGMGSTHVSSTQPVVFSSVSKATQSLPSASSLSAPPSNSGIAIDLRNTLQAETPIMVAVSLPKGTSTVGTGFAFALPESIHTLVQAKSSVEFTLPDGSPLPAWLNFNSEVVRFQANAVPSGAFPLQVALTVGEQRVLVVISERTE